VNNLEISKNKYQHLKNKITLNNGMMSIQPYQYQFSTLYSTYFICNSLDLLNHKFSNKEKTDIKLIVKKNVENLLNAQEYTSVMNDLYCALKIIEILNVEIEYNKIIEEILFNLKTEENAYADNYIEKNSDTVATARAIEVMYLSGIEPSRETIDWLTAKVNNTTLEYKNFNAIVQAISSLSLYGINLELPSKVINDILQNLRSNSNLSLFDIELYNRISKKFIKRDNLIDKDIQKLLYKKQNIDKGWNVFFEDDTEEQGIAIALNFLENSGLDYQKDEELYKLLLKQKSIDGGYSPFYKKVPSINSTFLVRYIDKEFSLKSSPIDIEKKDIIQYFNNDQAIDLYYYTSLLTEEGWDDPSLENSILEYIEIIKQKDNVTPSDLNNLYLYLKALEQINPTILSKIELGDISNKWREKSDFYSTLLFLNISNLIQETIEFDNFTGIYEKEIEDSKEEPYIIYLLSNLMLNYPDLNKIITKALTEKLINDNSLEKPISLEDLYYLLNAYSNLKKQ